MMHKVDVNAIVTSQACQHVYEVLLTVVIVFATDTLHQAVYHHMFDVQLLSAITNNCINHFRGDAAHLVIKPKPAFRPVHHFVNRLLSWPIVHRKLAQHSAKGADGPHLKTCDTNPLALSCKPKRCLTEHLRLAMPVCPLPKSHFTTTKANVVM